MSIIFWTKNKYSLLSKKKIKMGVPYDTAISLLGTHYKESNSAYCRDTYMPMFITALFTIAELWNQSRCSLKDEWINKLLYIYIMECFSVIKKNAIISFKEKQMELETLMLSEISQTQQDNCHIFSHMWNLEWKEK
jgi:hypothetical protein